ncbi:MAG: universal stress protein [Planctomycetia bacterium]|nr:universal stress protein [Planctomycetia bacterium]
MLAIHNILHPTDFSERSDHAFKLACALARDHGALLTIAHVLAPPVVVPVDGVVPVIPEDLEDQARARLLQVVPTDPKVRVERKLVLGDASHEIIALANQLRCDLIVLGTHGRTGLGRLLMGSVAETVLRKAECPVLTVKLPFPEVERAEEPVQAAVRPATA